MKKPRTERTSMIWNTFSSRVVSRPAMATISIRVSQPAIQSAALGLEAVVRSISEGCQACPRKCCGEGEGGPAGIGDPVRICNAQICRCSDAKRFRRGRVHAVGANVRQSGSGPSDHPGMTRTTEPGESAHAYLA